MEKDICARAAARCQRPPAQLLHVWMVVLLALYSALASADERATSQPVDALVQPDPSLAASEVLAIQLRALQVNDSPRLDSGIAQNWVLAHPRNKAGSGPYSRFVDKLRSPAYAALIDHRSHRLAVEHESSGKTRFLVLIETRSGDVLGYRWTMEKVSSGRRARCWMTTAVSLPILLGELA